MTTTRQSPKHGFNLIEMLVAMALLMTIIAVTCTMLAETDAAWLMGTGRARNAASGRAALAMLTRDLHQAAADSLLTMRIRVQPEMGYTNVSYGFTNDMIEFVSLQHDSTDSNRSARLIRYWVRMDPTPGLDHTRFELLRSCSFVPLDTNDWANCYWSTKWFDETVAETNTGVIARNVAAFALDWPDATNDVYLSTEQGNVLPTHVDILLELLDDRAALKADRIQDVNRAHDFVEQNVIRYSTRVFPPNRHTYRP